MQAAGPAFFIRCIAFHYNIFLSAIHCTGILCIFFGTLCSSQPFRQGQRQRHQGQASCNRVHCIPQNLADRLTVMFHQRNRKNSFLCRKLFHEFFSLIGAEFYDKM